MNWSEFYFACFIFGFGLSVIALLGGSARLHLPHLHLHHGGQMGRGGGSCNGGGSGGAGRLGSRGT